MNPEPCLDTATIEKLMKIGGKAFVIQMIDLFVNYIPKKLAEARAAEQSGDLLAVKQAVHPIKSGAGHIGAGPMADLAARIEQLASDQRAEPVAGLLAELDAAYVQVKSRLEQQRESLAAHDTENGQ